MGRLLFLIVLMFPACAEERDSTDKYSDFSGFSGTGVAGGTPGSPGMSETRPEAVLDTRSGGEIEQQNGSVETDAASADSVGSSPETASADAAETSASDGTVEEALEDSESDGEGTPRVVGEIALGMACELDVNCVDDLTCEAWPTPEGLCTRLACQNLGCGDGARCIQFDSTRWGCMPECDSSGDCREGDSCKPLWIDGGLVSVCHAIANKAGGDAAVCSVPADCTGKRTCIQDYGGGYCATLGCELTKPCSVGTACVALPEFNACLKMCDAANFCPGELLEVQECQTVTLINEEVQDVCVGISTAKEAGAYCESSEECLSGECQLNAAGFCDSGGSTCLSDADCSGGICLFTQGVCVQSCSYGQGCPEGTVCVPETPGLGECLKGCKSLSDIVTCKDMGTCEYGFPLEPVEEGEGVYACRPSPPGGFASSCTADEECVTGVCFKGNDEGDGICVADCGGLMLSGLNICPWGGACISVDGAFRCMPLCPKGNVQCEAGFSCQSEFLGLPFEMEICLPE